MSYGKSWENYPIEENEIYGFENSKVSIGDLTKELPEYMRGADMIYSDPPWSLRNVNMFNSKAGKDYINKFEEFDQPLFKAIDFIDPKVCYLEVGKENFLNFEIKMKLRFEFVQKWEIVYYKKHLCYLIRGSKTHLIDEDFAGLDDEITPKKAIEIENPNMVADFCTGRGLTGRAANDCGVDFVGIELNKRKLAVFIEKSNRKGFKYEKL